MPRRARDARETADAGGALARLRLYYPQEYRRQKSGGLKEKIAAFEAGTKKC